MHSRNYEITITGYVVGPIWWPTGEECFKPFRYSVTDHDARFVGGPVGLRRHCEGIVMEEGGDFQNCEIADAVLTITRRSGGRVVSRSWPLERFPSAADYVRTDWDGPIYDGDF